MTLLKKEITLPCGSTLTIEQIRTTSDAAKDESNSAWLPFVDFRYNGEIFNDEDEEIPQITLAIQLRSLNVLIPLLIEIQEELKK